MPCGAAEESGDATGTSGTIGVRVEVTLRAAASVTLYVTGVLVPGVMVDSAVKVTTPELMVQVPSLATVKLPLVMQLLGVAGSTMQLAVKFAEPVVASDEAPESMSVKVVVLDFDGEKRRISLGMKQLDANPWQNIKEEFPVNKMMKGKVTNIADYGAFIEVAEGVEGLIHVSEMSWSTHLRSAQDFVKVGDIVEGVILTLDRDDRKMSLGIKQLTQDPWTDITAKYPVGSKHTGIVRNFTNFGIFVELEEGIDGLIYISDLSWTKKIKHPSEFVNVGEKLDVVVLELDVEGRKLSLGHKQTTANPWDQYEDSFAVGTIHTGEISEIVDKGATVEFGDDIVAFIPTRHLEKEDGKKLKKGDSAEFKVIEFNKEFKRVVASHTAIFREEEEKNVKAVTEAVANNTNAQASTLGDNNDMLAELKAKMEKSEKK